MDILPRRLGATLLAFVFAVSSGLAADLCEAPRTALGGDPARLSDHQAEGDKTAARLTARYLDRQNDCGGNDRPLFLCSGVLLRGLARSSDKYTDDLAYQPWMPNRRKPDTTLPKDQQDKQKPMHPAGVSTSLMRADFQFGKLAYGYTAGIFFYPPADRPADTTAVEVICAYPIDAATDERGHLTFPYNTGCIRHYGYNPASGPCNAPLQRAPGSLIDTPEAWLVLYRSAGSDVHNGRREQCGFVLLDVTPKDEDATWDLVRTEAATDAPPRGYARDSAADFLAVVSIMHALNAAGSSPLDGESFGTQNEMMVRAWDVVPSSDAAATGPAYAEAAARAERQAPIEAFFYVGSDAAGKANAQVMQRLFLKRTGVWRPVIRFTLPKAADRKAAFAYIAADQSA
jgi:hypothetical protein